MKMAARASYRAVPSMLTVAPTGSTNLVMRRSTPRPSSRQRKVMGSVAELEERALEAENGGWQGGAGTAMGQRRDSAENTGRQRGSQSKGRMADT